MLNNYLEQVYPEQSHPTNIDLKKRYGMNAK